MNLNWRWLCSVLNSELAFTERLLPSLSPVLSPLFSFEQQSCSYYGVLSREGRHLWLSGESGSYHWLTLFRAYVCCLAAHAHTSTETHTLPLSVDTLAHTSKCVPSYTHGPRHLITGMTSCVRHVASHTARTHVHSTFSTRKVAV